MSDFIPNPQGMAALLNSAGVARHLAQVAAAVATEGRNIAPVGDDTDEHPGQYRDSIGSGVGTRGDGRLVGRAFSTDPDAAHIEFGTANTPAHQTLRRACENLGLHVVGNE